jgi:hypothetical protein
MNKREFFRSLPVPLTADELRERGQRLAAASLEVGRIEDAAKSAAAGFKQKVNEAKEEASRIAHIVHSRSEDRPVSCVEVSDKVNMMVHTRRLDTGEVVDSRSMSDRERAEALQEMIRFSPKEDENVDPVTGEVDSDGEAEFSAQP